LTSSPLSTAYPHRRCGTTGKSALSGFTTSLISSQLEFRDLPSQNPLESDASTFALLGRVLQSHWVARVIPGFAALMRQRLAAARGIFHITLVANDKKNRLKQVKKGQNCACSAQFLYMRRFFRCGNSLQAGCSRSALSGSVGGAMVLQSKEEGGH
jgi:hypothetical protein